MREVYEAFAEGDLDRLFALVDAEIELDLSQRLLEPEIFRGHEGLREFLRRQRDACRMSDIDVVARSAWVWELRDGLAIRITMHQSKAEALEAVALSE